MSGIGEKINNLPPDLFQRTILYSELEFTWYITNPVKYQFIMKAFAKNDTEIYIKTENKYNHAGQELFYQILQDVDTEQFRWDKETTIHMLKWFLEGFNADFIEQVKMQNEMDIDHTRKEYVKELSKYLKVLKEGIVKNIEI